MPRRPASFTEADIRRARKAAPDCTIEIVRPDGSVIRVIPDSGTEAAKHVNGTAKNAQDVVSSRLAAKLNG